MAKAEKYTPVKPITLKVQFDGESTECVYTLEFSRDTVKWIEGRGFDKDEIAKFPMKFYEFFWYAFRTHHKNVSRERTDRIIDELWGGLAGQPGIPDGVIARLIELYDQAFVVHGNLEETAKNGTATVEL